MQIKCYDTLPPEAVAIRKTVFVEEQGFKDEFDKTDDHAMHLVAYHNDTPIATCRFFKKTGTHTYVIGRIAVIKKYRGQNIGSSLLAAVEKSVAESKGTDIMLHAQLAARSFYEKHGYLPCGEIDSEEGCPHIWMCKQTGKDTK